MNKDWHRWIENSPLSYDSKVKFGKALDLIYAHLMGYRKITGYGTMKKGKSRNSNQSKF